ncbi:MBL fold metallo-hydrolase [Mycobacterium colombiense]|uniref:MBL fold metallo-hydrolase n=1 Tax=Mycobacterium colombiense TaxID=339268 RepID=UPI0007FBA189|nr:MBL fold metallo-hydrolase [Mycobacterium colombiense]OBJ38373.1 MBL fold metallo-hydrolase [Mycobacterium colombiense]
MAISTYQKGLQDLGGGCSAWMQPDGSWGWSNAGLITGAGCSLLIDTLFDLPCTRDMLRAMTAITQRNPITTVVNTHSDGDHYFGNQLVAGPGVEIIASEAAAERMNQEAVEEIVALTRHIGPLGDWVRKIFGPFDFEGIESTGPTLTFSGKHQLDVGGREVQLIQVGPAHTSGDTIVYVPDAKTLYTGDILFIGGTPIVWAGPPQRWVDACELILDLDVSAIVPGHGPVTDKSGVCQVRDYLTYLISEVTKRFEDGADVDTTILSLSQGDYANLPDSSRVVQNVVSVYQALSGDAVKLGRVDIFERMAALEGFTGDGMKR